MIIVGLSGSVASGKSTVANFFKERGAYIIDWDVLAREVVQPHQKAWGGIVEYFGEQILNDDLILNRQKLAEVVFNDMEKLARLNQITHPEIFKEDERITSEIKSHDPDALIVKDIPLLTKEARGRLVDKIVVVYAAKETQLKRLEERGLSREDAQKRIEAQLPIEEKISFADHVIYNDGSLEETKRQVEQVYMLLKGGEKR
jgi:dephospho-CoA kinase